MPRKLKNKKVGQAISEKELKKAKNKKIKEREDRIRQRKAQVDFDSDDEMVIQMTNRNNIAKERKRITKEKREEMKKKKRMKKIKIVLELIMILGLVSGAIVFAMTSPIFNIKEIVVINNVNVSSEEIISLSELQTGENLFKFLKTGVRNKIKENPYVEDIKIRRKIPSIVEINVIEREPKYSIDFMEKFAYINTQGYILEISDENKNLPVIRGITTAEEQIVPGNRLDNNDLIMLEDIIKIMNIAKEDGLSEKVSSINIIEKNNYSIDIEEEKKTIYLGDNTNLENKMLNAIAIIEKEKGNEGYIYVNGDLNNKFKPYFKKKV